MCSQETCKRYKHWQHRNNVIYKVDREKDYCVCQVPHLSWVSQNKSFVSENIIEVYTQFKGINTKRMQANKLDSTEGVGNSGKMELY